MTLADHHCLDLSLNLTYMNYLCDNLRSGSEESGSGCVKVFSEPGFIVAGNGSARGYFG